MLRGRYRRGPHPQDLIQPGQFVLNFANMRACLYPIAADRHQQSCDATVARRRQAIQWSDPECQK
jgi:hypothetical protein